VCEHALAAVGNLATNSANRQSIADAGRHCHSLFFLYATRC
jgi:hypothetical protein